jgi:hypothetical protein
MISATYCFYVFYIGDRPCGFWGQALRVATISLAMMIAVRGTWSAPAGLFVLRFSGPLLLL